MLNLSLKHLKLIAKYRGIIGYKNMSNDELLRILKISKPIRKNKTIKDTKKYLETRDLLFLNQNQYKKKILILVEYLKA